MTISTPDMTATKLTINKRSAVAAYKQLKDIIYSQIKNGEIKPSEMLSSEAELCKKYDISRITVRQALRQLIDDGLLYTIKGKGTFVAEPKLEQIMVKIPDFFEEMADRGKRPEVKVLDVSVVEASPAISEKLQVPLGEQVFRIKRLFLAENKPHILEKKFIVCRDCKILRSRSEKGILDIYEKDKEIFDVLAGRCHICSEYAEVTIDATLIRPYESKFLQAPAGSAAFYIDMVAYKEDGTPCGWISSIRRGDLYRLKTRVHNFPVSK